MVNTGMDGVVVPNTWVSGRIGRMLVRPESSLEAGNQQSSYRNDGTHVKDTKNLVEVQPPGGDRLFVVLRVVTPRDRITFVSLDDVPPDFVCNPIRELSEEIARRTHR